MIRDLTSAEIVTLRALLLRVFHSLDAMRTAPSEGDETI
jgi:hypothetical protein